VNKNNPYSFHPTLDTLSDRVVPTVSLANGDIHISGSNSVEVVHVRRVGATYEVTENATTVFIPASRVTGGDVVYIGLGGNDSFTNSTALRTKANGGAGSDTIVGGAGKDALEGGGGSDFIYGAGGTDELFAYSKAAPESEGVYNYLNGGDGMDFVHGGSGVDYLDGGRGEDYLFGYGGNDTLHAGNVTGGDFSYNYLNGGVGDDTLYGGEWSDYMIGHLTPCPAATAPTTCSAGTGWT
jgi:Ca2+-binding RTX toxin-like protein